MKTYDAVIIGAGPAGGQCARELSKAGFKVLIAEKSKDFFENNYSSGGAPLDFMHDFDLPDTIVGSFWNILRIESSSSKATWTSPSPFGSVIDFAKLRKFLTDQAVLYGAKFRLGCAYQEHQIQATAIEVKLKDLKSAETFAVQAKVLIDATGNDRKVLASKAFDKSRTIVSTGIEYLVEASAEAYEQYSHALNFYLGHKWMPQGYAWIFPMADNQLKAGVIRYFQNKHYVPYDPSFKPYLNSLLERCQVKTILDQHGKTIYYTPHQKDLKSEGPVLAVGDAISSINPLGWEGIRHAMASGRAAAQTIQSYLKGESKDLKGYDKKMDHYFGWKWWFSEKMMLHLFKTKNDALIDHSVSSFSLMNNDEIMKVTFGYQYKYTIKSYLAYFLKRLKGIFS